MEIHPLFFYSFAVMAIAFSLLVVFKRTPTASAFSLVMVFFSFAGIYAILDAHLVAALQVLVYAGAIMVLFVFVIMLLHADVPSFDMGRTHIGTRIASGGMILIFLVMTIYAIKNSPQAVMTGVFSAENVKALGGNTKVVSSLMFSEYILPFELTSVLLLAAIIAAVAIAKRKGTS
jgi:NADH-quinone oxidoreductase subunit J